MLLAAGAGTRLRPITDSIPKCMIRIAGKPLLEHNLLWLKKFGVEEVIINLHHLPERVIEYFGRGERLGIQIHFSHEENILGTAGGVKRAQASLPSPFFVWYGDNLSRCDLHRLYSLHESKQATVTMAVFERQDVSQSGIVGLDSEQRVTRFLEKPKTGQIFSHFVNAGIFAMDPDVFGYIPSGFCDFSLDVLPRMLDDGCRIFGYPLSSSEGLWWIDRLEDLESVEQQVARGEVPTTGSINGEH